MWVQLFVLQDHGPLQGERVFVPPRDFFSPRLQPSASSLPGLDAARGSGHSPAPLSTHPHSPPVWNPWVPSPPLPSRQVHLVDPVNPFRERRRNVGAGLSSLSRLWVTSPRRCQSASVWGLGGPSSELLCRGSVGPGATFTRPTVTGRGLGRQGGEAGP